MMRSRLLLLLGTLLLALTGIVNAQSKNLDIYWIDVEGGAATLIVAPSGESLLYDAGYAVDDRDAKRIYAATKQAGLKKIDGFVLSHYHGDHVGGLPALAKMIPIDRFYDHGNEVDDVDRERLQLYKQGAGTTAAGRRNRGWRRNDSEYGRAIRSLSGAYLEGLAAFHLQ